MAAANYLPSEDEFLCSICLDVFTDPVATSCGHNFCKNCITELWNTNDQHLCPMCKEGFTTRPHLRVNTLVSEIVAQFRQSAQQKASSSSSSSEQQVAKPGEVPCDVCTGTKLKALKSCLVCLVSYCETHLEPHLTMPRLKRHQLIDPVENLEGRMCTTHDKPLELFCKTDQTCVCMLCTVLDHKTHDFVPLTEEYERKKAEVSVHPSSYEGTVVKAVAQLEETLGKEMKLIPESELKRVQQYAVDVTLDPDTAHPNLILSDDGKQVNDSSLLSIKTLVTLSTLLWKNLRDNQKRFSKCVNVLGKQSFSSGRFYFEVQVKGNTEWDLGVARESINRKGSITLNPQKGYWTIVLRNGNEYYAAADPPVCLSLKSPPQKVGVFVDYEEGLVSFHDVDAAALIYSFTGCSFTEKLFPFFGPGLNEYGENSATLIISPVRVN